MDKRDLPNNNIIQIIPVGPYIVCVCVYIYIYIYTCITIAFVLSKYYWVNYVIICMHIYAP